MKLTLAMVSAIALCLGSLAARSRASRPLPAAEVAAPAGSDRIVMAAVDGHLRAKLHKLAQR